MVELTNRARLAGYALVFALNDSFAGRCTGEAMKRILHWFAGITAGFKRPDRDASTPPGAALHIVPEPLAEEPPAAPSTITAADAVDDKVDRENAAGAVTLTAPDPQELKRRRELVRAMFNEFWSDRIDKPASFVDRLNEAESYLNERLAASGESWQLDAEARDMLGLPAHSASGNGRHPT